MNIVVLGSTGMLGHMVASRAKSEHEVYEINRNELDASRFTEEDFFLVSKLNPDVVINCMGIIKQLKEGPELSYAVNAVFPHKLSHLCHDFGIRLVHISTDCVYSGNKGNYVETDFSDVNDTYGNSKYLGEVDYCPETITLRTSIIGHEKSGKNLSLVDWFLSQTGSVNGFSKAIFSGFPTVELADIILNYVLPDEGLSGLYHVSAEPIDKYNLLTLIKERYAFDIEINKETEFTIDRSLNSDRFKMDTGYEPPNWPELIDKMFDTK